MSLGLLALGLVLGIGIGAIALSRRAKNKIADAVMDAADALVSDDDSPPRVPNELDHLIGIAANDLLLALNTYFPEDDTYWKEYWEAEHNRLSLMIKESGKGQ